MRKVVVEKIDMDTCLTAFILGVSEKDDIVAVRDQASPEDLGNPDVICIECGGSGEIELNNFDHHNTNEDLPPACVQAFRVKDEPEHLRPIVEYVRALDVDFASLKARSQEVAFPTLSDVFSGVLILERSPREQLLKGMVVIERVLQKGLDPFGTMPEYPEWSDYIQAKRKVIDEVEKTKANARIFTSVRGLKVGYLETDFVGAPGALYSLGCDVAIVYSPKFGNPPIPKYTISGNNIRVDHLIPILDEKDLGWGGPAHGTIIGSPRTEDGSRLKPEEVIRLVSENV